MRYFLVLILGLGFLLRILWLDSYPVGFTPDEASFGYDAYSILKTGSDQWGEKFPLVLKSFGDYKSPLYSYLAIPSVAVFGLNKFSVRLPNAILGTAAIYVLYLLTRKLRSSKFLEINDARFDYIPALLLAVSPWHIALSRGAFEANLTTFFLPLGIYLFLTKKYVWTGTLLGLNLFTYHAAKLVTPIVFLGLIYLLKIRLRTIFPALITFGIFLAFNVYTFALGAGARVSERSITNGALEVGAKAKIELINEGWNPYVARLLHNKYQVTAARFIDNYFQYYSPRFLILSGPAETTYGMVKGLGVLTYAEILGIISLVVFYRKAKRAIWPVVMWLVLAPIPAALSTGVGYAGNRAVGMIPAIQILAAYGLYLLMNAQKQAKYFIGLTVYVGLLVFMYRYIALSPKESAKGMLLGNLEYAKTVTSIENKYDNVIIPRSLSEPHIYIAFASSYPPDLYQENTKTWDLAKYNVSWVDQIPRYTLGKYTFK